MAHHLTKVIEKTKNTSALIIGTFAPIHVYKQSFINYLLWKHFGFWIDLMLEAEDFATWFVLAIISTARFLTATFNTLKDTSWCSEVSYFMVSNFNFLQTKDSLEPRRDDTANTPPQVKYFKVVLVLSYSSQVTFLLSSVLCQSRTESLFDLSSTRPDTKSYSESRW